MSWSRDENAIAPESPDVFSLPGGGAAVTKADGQFAFGGVDGWVVLRHAGSPALALKSVTAAGVDVTDGFDMKRAAAPFEVHLTSQVSTISGVVKSADGGAVAACDVVVFAADPASWKLPFSRRVVLVRADDKGEFQVTGCPPARTWPRRRPISIAPYGPIPIVWSAGALSQHHSRSLTAKRRRLHSSGTDRDNHDPSSARTAVDCSASADSRAGANRTIVGTRHCRGHWSPGAVGGHSAGGPQAGSQSARMATTDDEGRFLLRDVVVGQCTLTLSKAGFVRGHSV